LSTKRIIACIGFVGFALAVLAEWFIAFASANVLGVLIVLLSPAVWIFPHDVRGDFYGNWGALAFVGIANGVLYATLGGGIVSLIARLRRKATKS
jgi:hypothetical protein